MSSAKTKPISGTEPWPALPPAPEPRVMVAQFSMDDAFDHVDHIHGPYETGMDEMKERPRPGWGGETIHTGPMPATIAAELLRRLEKFGVRWEVYDITSDYTFLVTSADPGYDGFGTITIGTKGKDRVVAVEKQHETWQTRRYGSGAHSYEPYSPKAASKKASSKMGKSPSSKPRSGKKPSGKTPSAKPSSAKQYKGWSVERYEGSQVGYRTEAGAAGRGRKVKGWFVSHPEYSPKGKLLDTIRAAQEYIDSFDDLSPKSPSPRKPTPKKPTSRKPTPKKPSSATVKRVDAAFLEEMQELLSRRGYDPREAVRLQAEGMGPDELKDRLKHKPGSVGSIEYTHAITSKRPTKKPSSRKPTPKKPTSRKPTPKKASSGKKPSAPKQASAKASSPKKPSPVRPGHVKRGDQLEGGWIVQKVSGGGRSVTVYLPETGAPRGSRLGKPLTFTWKPERSWWTRQHEPMPRPVGIIQPRDLPAQMRDPARYESLDAGADVYQGAYLFLDTHSLEDFKKGAPSSIIRKVKVRDIYDYDGPKRVSVEIVEGPEYGRMVTGLSPSNLQDKARAGAKATSAKKPSPKRPSGKVPSQRKPSPKRPSGKKPSIRMGHGVSLDPNFRLKEPSRRRCLTQRQIEAEIGHNVADKFLTDHPGFTQAAASRLAEMAHKGLTYRQPDILEVIEEAAEKTGDPIVKTGIYDLDDVYKSLSGSVFLPSAETDDVVRFMCTEVPEAPAEGSDAAQRAAWAFRSVHMRPEDAAGIVEALATLQTETEVGSIQQVGVAPLSEEVFADAIEMWLKDIARRDGFVSETDDLMTAFEKAEVAIRVELPAGSVEDHAFYVPGKDVARTPVGVLEFLTDKREAWESATVTDPEDSLYTGQVNENVIALNDAIAKYERLAGAQARSRKPAPKAPSPRKPSTRKAPTPRKPSPKRPSSKVPIVLARQDPNGRWKNIIVIETGRVTLFDMEPAVIAGWNVRRIEVQAGEDWFGMSAESIAKYKRQGDTMGLLRDATPSEREFALSRMPGAKAPSPRKPSPKKPSSRKPSPKTPSQKKPTPPPGGFISSGKPEIDAIVGGGFPRGRITQIEGPRAFEIATGAFPTAIVDCSGNLTAEHLQSLGLSPAKVLVSQPDSIAEMMDQAISFVRDGARLVIINELPGVASPPAVASQLMRKITSAAHGTESTVVFAQTYPPEDASISNALKFYSSLRLQLKPSADGVRLKVLKNKFATPFQEIDVPLAPLPSAKAPSPRKPSPKKPSSKRPSAKAPSPKKPTPRAPSPRKPSPKKPTSKKPSPVKRESRGPHMHITDPDALKLLGKIEGAGWLAKQSQGGIGLDNGFYLNLAAYGAIVEQGLLDAGLPLGDLDPAAGTIMGDGGSFYVVMPDGEVMLYGDSATKTKRDVAAKVMVVIEE